MIKNNNTSYLDNLTIYSHQKIASIVAETRKHCIYLQGFGEKFLVSMRDARGWRIGHIFKILGVIQLV